MVRIFRPVLRGIPILLLLLCAFLCDRAQGQATGGSLGQITSKDRTLNLLVSVREQNGMPLSQQAIVHLSTDLGGQNIMGITRDGSTASFPNIKGGDYVIDVESVGYKPTRERASVLGVASYTVYIYMIPEGAAESNAPTDSRPLMTPKLQKEMDRALMAIRERKYAEARTHLLAANKLAPSNPDIEYLLGMADYMERSLEPARAHFEKALSLAPGHERTLVSLGQLQMEMRDYKKSVSYLETAVLNNSRNAQAHLLLSICYLNLQNYAKARVEGLSAADLDKAKAPVGRMIAAKTYLLEKNIDGGAEALADYLRDFPNEKGAGEAKQLLERIAALHNASVGPETSSVATAHTTEPAAIEHPWAPADTDENIPTVAPDVVCSTKEIVDRTSKRSQMALIDFERFGATERIDHQEIDSLGNPGPVKSRDFSYMALIQRPTPDFYFVDERRDGGEAFYAFPTSLVTRGLISIGINVFHPTFISDFNFSCEGLGRWLGRPAWQLRFEQRDGVPSRIRSWSFQGKSYAVGLKGRVWISPNTFDIMHLETDLRNPIKELQLSREHLSVDYGPISFKQVKEELWLPVTAEMYFSILGRRYHHKHTLSDYVLFSVDEKSKISAPPQPPEEK